MPDCTTWHCYTLVHSKIAPGCSKAILAQKIPWTGRIFLINVCVHSVHPLSCQKLRQELLSRQGSVEATRDSVSKLLHSSDAPMDSDLQSALDKLTQRYAAAQACQAEWEVELKALLPRLENYERLGSDLQVFTQSRLKALSLVGQPDRSIDEYRQTIEVRTVLRFLYCTYIC